MAVPVEPAELSPPAKLQEPRRARTFEISAEWRHGWALVLVAALGLAISTSQTYVTGLFIGPIEKEFGWSRSEISSGFLVASAVAVVCSPFVGLLIDRFGTRRIGLPGMAVYCAAIALFAMTGPSPWTWWSIWFVLAVGDLFIKPTLWAVAISKQFDAQRALALAVMLCGSGIGSSVLPLLTSTLIGTVGWRGAYVTLGCGFALLALPLMYVVLREDSEARDRAHLARATLTGLTIGEALRSTRFLRMALTALIMTIAMGGFMVHFVPFVTSKGIDRATAAMAMTIIGVTSVVARLGTGMLLDRWNGPVVGMIGFGIPIIAAFSWLHFDGTATSATLIAATLGIALGAETDIIAYLSTRYFGLRNYGTIFGTIAGVLVLGTGIGPTLAGLTYDRTHSYDLFVWATIPAFLLSAAMVGSLGRYPVFAARQ